MKEDSNSYTQPETVTLLFVGHGSRRVQSNEELKSLVKLFQQKHPHFKTTYAFVELAKPSFNQLVFKEAAREECQTLILLPLFLFSSRHVKNDIPLVVSKVQSQYPEKKIICADSMKASEFLVQLACQKIKKNRSESGSQ